jgi:short-subunit dehydrogenase
MRLMPSQHPSTFTLITGATGGMGLELARQAAADGQNLILVAQDLPRLETAADELRCSVSVHTIAEDLSQPSAAQRAYDQVPALGAEVDCLINHAGFGDYGSFVTCDLAKQQRMIGVNITLNAQGSH